MYESPHKQQALPTPAPPSLPWPLPTTHYRTTHHPPVPDGELHESIGVARQGPERHAVALHKGPVGLVGGEPHDVAVGRLLQPARQRHGGLHVAPRARHLHARCAMQAQWTSKGCGGACTEQSTVPRSVAAPPGTRSFHPV